MVASTLRIRISGLPQHGPEVGGVLRLEILPLRDLALSAQVLGNQIPGLDRVVQRLLEFLLSQIGRLKMLAQRIKVLITTPEGQVRDGEAQALVQDVEVSLAIHLANDGIGEVAFAEWVNKTTLLTDGDRAHLGTVGILTEEICDLWDRRILGDDVAVPRREKWGPEQLALDRATGC